mmetsp:Transcript_12355/g.37684  ORF Transcript_12355/g.37684 Transcript_12355/m.37684 type:complete len:221 (+) Transcript_12355:54-716(+)
MAWGLEAMGVEDQGPRMMRSYKQAFRKKESSENKSNENKVVNKPAQEDFKSFRNFRSMLLGCSGDDNRPDFSTPIDLSDAEWRKQLNTEQYRVLRKCVMERPGTVERKTFPMNVYPRPCGIFCCMGCDNYLFDTLNYVDCCQGFPGFKKSFPLALVQQQGDQRSPSVVHFKCARCSGYIGYNDSQLFLVNSTALHFKTATKSEINNTIRAQGKKQAEQTC